MAGEQIRAVLGANLKKWRLRRKWSQMKLAEEADISMNFLSEIERGVKWPFPETLQNLATALNVEVFELFKKENEKDPGPGKIMGRFSDDIAIAVEQAVKKAVLAINKQYKINGR